MGHDPDDIPREAPQEWLDALERGRADIAAGRVHDWSDVRAELLARIAKAEAVPAKRRA